MSNLPRVRRQSALAPRGGVSGEKRQANRNGVLDAYLIGWGFRGGLRWFGDADGGYCRACWGVDLMVVCLRDVEGSGVLGFQGSGA